MRENDDGKTVAAMDMLVPRVLSMTWFILSTVLGVVLKMNIVECEITFFFNIHTS